MITAGSIINRVLREGAKAALNNCGIKTADLQPSGISDYCIWTSAGSWGHVHPEGIVTRYDIIRDMHVIVPEKTKSWEA